MGAGAASAAAMGVIVKAESKIAAADAIPLARPLAIDELSTPALLIDLDRMDGNLRKMAEHARDRSVDLRPHTKNLLRK